MMKNLAQNLIIILLFAGTFSCKKAMDTVPIVKTDTFAGCRISQIEDERGVTLVNNFDKEGYLAGGTMKFSFSEVTINNKFENGLIIGSTNSNKNEEKYEYKNGALSKITIVNTESSKSYLKGYYIDIETDANKRISKMTDSNGLQNVITRDANGNINTILQTNLNDKRVNYKIEISGYDNKKTVNELLKGYPFDFITTPYALYMTQGVLHSIGGTGGNASKIKIWNGLTQISDVDIKYEFSPAGYPTVINQVENLQFLPNKIFKFSYSDCK